MSWDRMVLERQWLKSVALVESGARVTLEVPREQRTWMRLDYRHGGSGSGAVTLEGCRVSRTQQAQERECQVKPYDACRRGPTAFSGGFLIEYARAPKQGRCAEIIVWVDGVREPLRERLVSARAGRCG